MKRIHQIIAYSLVACVTLLSACTEEYEYQPAANGEGGNAYIVGDVFTTLGFEGDQPLTFTLKLQRTNAEKAEEVKLTADNKVVQLPASVSFKAGEKTKEVQIPFVSSEASTETVKIGIANENASLYGVTSATYVLEHYKTRKADYMSNWFRNTFNGIKVLEAGNQHYKLVIPYKDLKGEPFRPIEMVVDKDNNVFVMPQPVYHEKSNSGDEVLLYVVGNWNGDASQKFSDADIENVSRFAGTYNPEEKVFTLNFFWYAPNYGWWGWDNETIGLLD